MQPYHLAKLIQWAPAGKLKSRKRMQKVVFLLQAAGCAEFDADFILHHYGPYSQDVAALTDQMVSAGLLLEEAEPNQQIGSSYSYRLSDSAKNSLERFEREESGKQMAARLEPFQDRAEELFKTDLKELEYAATVVYFHRQQADWKKAERKTCRFKNLAAGGASVRAATALAKRFVA
jgi:uncharacterized protein YwgA